MILAIAADVGLGSKVRRYVKSVSDPNGTLRRRLLQPSKGPHLAGLSHLKKEIL
jgi:hypothetical protein